MHTLHANQLNIAGRRRSGDHGHRTLVGDAFNRLRHQLHNCRFRHHAYMVVGYQGNRTAAFLWGGVQENGAGLSAPFS